MQTDAQHNQIKADMVQSKCLTNQVVSELSSMGTDNSIRTEHLQSTSQDGSNPIAGALKNLTNDLEDPLGYIVVHHDSVTVTNGASGAPTAHKGEQAEAATGFENISGNAERDRASATTSAGHGSSRLAVQKLKPPLDPHMVPSSSSLKKPPSHHILPMKPAIPRIFERRQRQPTSVVGEGLRTNGGPVRERQDERSAETRSEVGKASHTAIEVMMASQAPSSVDQKDSQPLSCCSSSSAPITESGHTDTSSCAVEKSQASSGRRIWSMPAETIGHRKSSSVDTGIFHHRELDSRRTPAKGLGHRRSFSPLASEFRPSRNSSVPSTPSNLGLPVHSRQPSGGSDEPTDLDIAASDTVRGNRYQQHGHPTSTYHSPQLPRPWASATTPPIFQDALAPMDPAVFSPRRLSLAYDMHHSQAHCAPWQTISRIGNAYLVKQNENNSEYTQPNPFDSYTTSTPAAPTPNPSDVQTNAALYAADTNGFQPAYFTNSNSSNQIV